MSTVQNKVSSAPDADVGTRSVGLACRFETDAGQDGWQEGTDARLSLVSVSVHSNHSKIEMRTKLTQKYVTGNRYVEGRQSILLACLTSKVKSVDRGALAANLLVAMCRSLSLSWHLGLSGTREL